jgi:hypothetical protein
MNQTPWFTLSAKNYFIQNNQSISSRYCKHMVELKWLAHCEKPSVFYTTELVNSYFHLYERDYNHDHVDVDSLVAGTADVDEDPVALYLGYYD